MSKVSRKGYGLRTLETAKLKAELHRNDFITVLNYVDIQHTHAFTARRFALLYSSHSLTSRVDVGLFLERSAFHAPPVTTVCRCHQDVPER